jgi:hypothetical protein
MSQMKVYLRLLLFVVYVTDEGLHKIITVRTIIILSGPSLVSWDKNSNILKYTVISDIHDEQ